MKEFGFEYFQFKERKAKHSEKVHPTVKGRLINEVLDCSKFGLRHSVYLSVSLSQTHTCAVKMLVSIQKQRFV